MGKKSAMQREGASFTEFFEAQRELYEKYVKPLVWFLHPDCEEPRHTEHPDIEQMLGWDAIVKDDGGRIDGQVTYEVKIVQDFYLHLFLVFGNYPNEAKQEWSGVPKFVPGWMWTGRQDWLLYCMNLSDDHLLAIKIRFRELQSWLLLDDYYKKYQAVRMPHPYGTQGRKVPIEDVVEAIDGVYFYIITSDLKVITLDEWPGAYTVLKGRIGVRLQRRDGRLYMVAETEQQSKWINSKFPEGQAVTLKATRIKGKVSIKLPASPEGATTE